MKIQQNGFTKLKSILTCESFFKKLVIFMFNNGIDLNKPLSNGIYPLEGKIFVYRLFCT